ncbi:hypothetical protein OLK001_25130 [Synechocystis sp. LKSZ1]
MEARKTLPLLDVGNYSGFANPANSILVAVQYALASLQASIIEMRKIILAYDKALAAGRGYDGLNDIDYPEFHSKKKEITQVYVNFCKFMLG